MANHLIIGLGGTGGKIIRSLKKTIYQEFRENEITDTCIGYVYVDSNKGMMDPDDSSWKILGTSVQLGKDSKVLIANAQLEHVLNDIDKFPGIKPWIGRRDNWIEILNAIQDDAAGGQKRRLGRFLFGCSVSSFEIILNKQVQCLRDNSNLANVTFHICCGLAGGTGSGILIDVLNIVRDRFRPTQNDPFKIILYLFLPDTFPPPNWDAGYYHANGYASLLELNSLSVGVFKPYDITGNKERFSNVNPFNGCYLFTNQNENGLVLDVDKDIPNLVADYLYQKIIAVKDLTWDSLSRAENAENGDSTPETSPNSKIGERSKRFLTFGIKRLSIPEQEIKEYITYNYIKQSLLQLKYNNWMDEIGYISKETNQDFSEFVRQNETNIRWQISDEHLCQSIGILRDDIKNKKWKPIKDSWKEYILTFKGLVKVGVNENWLDEFERLSEKYYRIDYRGIGVRNFYTNKIRNKQEIVKELRECIEKELFNDWKNGNKSLFDIKKLLETLIDWVKEKSQLYNNKIAEQKEIEEENSKKIEYNKGIWAKRGIWANISGKKDKILDKHELLLLSYYVAKTYVDGFQLAMQITQELETELINLKTKVELGMSTINETLENYEKEILARCKEGTVDYKSQIIRFYEPQKVKDITNSLIKNQEEQKSQTYNVRTTLINLLDNEFNFSKFSQKIGTDELRDSIEQVCENNVNIAHNNLVSEKLFNINIIEKMKLKYGTNDTSLKKFISELVKFAGNYLIFDNNEKIKKGVGIPTSPTMITTLTVIYPKSPHNLEFIQKLKNAFNESTNIRIDFLESDLKTNEITIISIINLFPLRFVSQVSFLREKYISRITRGDSDKEKILIHIEGDGMQHPRLFVMTENEWKEEQEKVRDTSIPYVMLAEVMGIITSLIDPATGETKRALLRKKLSGADDDPIFMGKTMLDSYCTVEDYDKLNNIKKYILTILEKDYNSYERKQSLQQDLLNKLKEIKVIRNNNILDPIYKKFNNGIDFAITKVLNLSGE